MGPLKKSKIVLMASVTLLLSRYFSFYMLIFLARNIITILLNLLPLDNKKHPRASNPIAYPKYLYLSKLSSFLRKIFNNSKWPQIHLLEDINIHPLSMSKCHFFLF